VFWKQGEKADTKTINVKVGKDFTVKHIKVTSSTPDFQAKVEEAGKGQFKIDVKPQDTNKVVASMLTIQPEDSQKVFYATARITNARLFQSLQLVRLAPARPLLRLVKRIEILTGTPGCCMAALALLPAAGEAIYFRDKISWRSAIAPSEMVTVEQARGWGDTAIWR